MSEIEIESKFESERVEDWESEGGAVHTEPVRSGTDVEAEAPPGPHGAVQFVSDDSDVMFVGTAWPDGVDRDDMLVYLELRECTGAEAAMVLSRWQVRGLRDRLTEILGDGAEAGTDGEDS